MSLKPLVIEPVPEETARVAGAAFSKGNIYLAMRDEIGIAFSDNDFTELFPRRGQPAFAPWRLALIIVMQFLENLSDRQAADAVRSRIDWKYALGLELTDAGFDYSVLSGFRERLASGGKQTLLLDRMLELFKEKKLLKARAKQRTDPGARFSGDSCPESLGNGHRNNARRAQSDRERCTRMANSSLNPGMV